MARLPKITDEISKSKDLFKILEKYKGKEVQVSAFGTFFSGKINKVDHKKGQVEIKEGEDVVTIEIERITEIHPI